jgi:cyclic-di-AMP phosphodiesterase PgpH
VTKNSISKTRSKRSRKLQKASAARSFRNASFPWHAVPAFALLWLTAFFLLFGSRMGSRHSLSLDQRAPATVVAETDFQCVDLGASELQRARAANEVPPVFTVNATPLSAAIHDLEKVYDRVVLHRKTEGPEAGAAGVPLGEALELIGVDLDARGALSLFPPEMGERALDRLVGILRSVWTDGIASPSQILSAFEQSATERRIMIQGPDEATNRIAAVDALRTPAEAADEAARRAAARLPGDRGPDPYRALFSSWMQPNLRYHQGRTDALREVARRAVEPVQTTVRAGSTLVEIGERVTEQTLEKLTAHDRKLALTQTPTDRILRLTGGGFMLLAGLSLCAGVLFLVRPFHLHNRTSLYAMVFLALLTLLGVRGLIWLAGLTRWISPSLIHALFPLAMASILAAILLDGTAAVAIGLWVSAAASILFGNSFPVLLEGITVSVVAALACRGVRRRSHIFRGSLWVGAVLFLLLISYGISNRMAAPTILLHGSLGLLNGLLCGLLALLLIPLFEVTFGLTTDIRLLELSDMGHPLLQRMAIEAPGTYHHSLMVANLAQRAADDIGANSLLVRVCAYFHDIGKLTKPEFFTENIQSRDNPHDDLSPSMSTLVIMSHVKEGVGLALRYKLPRPVLDAIQQHHGTGIVSYFYHRARKNAVEETGVKEEDFRYPGPRPGSREMAILSLADSVEAASRSIDNPSSSRIENLVNEIVESRLRDGQLDQSALTFEELTRVQRSFVFTLTNMLHGRVAYPSDEDGDREPTREAPVPPAGRENPDAALDQSG